jgi:hypothetical protein
MISPCPLWYLLEDLLICWIHKRIVEEVILEFRAHTVSASIRDNVGSIFLVVFCFRYCEACKDGTQLGHYN